MDGLGLLIAIVAFVLGLIALNKIAKLETRIAQLKLELGGLIGEAAKLRAGAAPVTAEAAAGTPQLPEWLAAPAGVAPSEIPVEAPQPAESPAAADLAPASSQPEAATSVHWQPQKTPAEAAPRPAARDMEQALASRWFVWIGGVAIAIGGLLFVKYAYDNGLISPTLQIVLGLVAGGALVAAGDMVRRRAAPAVEMTYVPAALSAAGLAIVFASIYAAYALYVLIPPPIAFIGMAAVGLGSLALSRWQGPLIAALGLLGSYVTPALIPSESPSAWSFFPYLLIILAACFATLRGRTWWWLGYAAIAASAAWTGLWIKGGLFAPGDVWPVGVFAHLLGLIGFFGIAGPRGLSEPVGDLLQPPPSLLIGIAGLAAEIVLLGLLLDQMHHAAPALMLFAAAVAVLLAIAWFKPGLAVFAPLAGLLMLVALMAWSEAAFHAMTLDEQGRWTWSNAISPHTERFLRWTIGAGAVFTFAGIAGVLARPAPREWGVLAAAAGFLFAWGAWARADFLLTETTWAILATLFAAVLLAGAAAANRRADEPPVNLTAGLLLAGSAALLILALDRLFDRVWLTIALALLATAYALLTGVLRPWLLGPIATALASLSALRLFVSRELWNDDRTIAWGQHWVVYGYGVPAVLFYAASRVLRTAGHGRSATAMEGISLGLVISLIALELRVWIAGGIIYEEPQFLEMAAHALTWLGAAYGLMHRQRLFSSVIALWGARVLIGMALFVTVALSLVALNPLVTGAPVPGNLVLNALLLAYLAPLVLLGLIARRLDVIGWQQLRPVFGGLALLLAFAYLTLETKLVFQGKLMVPWSLTIAESYAYSAVWLAFALALFVAGLRLARQYVRYAGLGVMVLVVLKVFLWDMSNLEGLYRIASFVGLGLCLVGIGWLYQRFVQKPRQEPAKGG